MVGGEHTMHFIFTITTTTAVLPPRKQRPDEQQEVGGDWSSILLNVKVNQRHKVLSPTTSNTISIHCGVLKLPDIFSAPTQHTFSIVTVAAIHCIKQMYCMGEEWLNQKSKIQVIQWICSSCQHFYRKLQSCYLQFLNYCCGLQDLFIGVTVFSKQNLFHDYLNCDEWR